MRERQATYIQAVKDYADHGGRLFLEHDHIYWLRSGYMPWPDHREVRGATTPTTSAEPLHLEDRCDFPKGRSLLRLVLQRRRRRRPSKPSASTTPVSGDRKRLPPETQQWIYTDKNPQDPGTAVQYMTMNTPVENDRPPRTNVGAWSSPTCTWSAIPRTRATSPTPITHFQRVRVERAHATGKSARIHAVRSVVLRASGEQGAGAPPAIIR